MSKKSDNDALLAAGLGLLGFGLLAAAASGSANRQSFSEQLAVALANHGLSLVKCELGRAANNAPIWTVTFQHPARGVMSLIATSPMGTPPYAATTATQVATRIVAYLQGS